MSVSTAVFEVSATIVAMSKEQLVMVEFISSNSALVVAKTLDLDTIKTDMILINRKVTHWLIKQVDLGNDF